jgi:CubicO group peptidase (beta-lactamase class C family)
MSADLVPRETGAELTPARAARLGSRVMAAVAELQVEVDPDEVGLDRERLAHLDRHLARLVDGGTIPCALAVVARGGRVAHVFRHGDRDPRVGAPLEPDAIFRIYSMTKPVTAVAALLLYEEGAFDLNDPVAKFIPSFGEMRVYRGGSPLAPVTVPAQEQMRVWHTFTHTTGLTYEFFYSTAVDQMYRNAGFKPFSGHEEFTLEEACERWASIPLLFEPGSEWNYSVSNDVLGRIVEVVSGMRLDDFFRTRIFEPLGMPDTGFHVEAAKLDRVAALYTPDPQSPSRAVPHPLLDAVRTQRPSYLSGGGGLYSTAHDYHRFMQLLLRRGELDGVRLLSRKTVELMASNHLPGGADLGTFGRPLYVDEPPMAGVGYGLGISVLLDPAQAKEPGSPGRLRWGGAANTDFFVGPAEELTAAFFTQLLPANNQIRRDYRRLTYQAIVD